MSLLTAEERLVLEAADARIRQKREFAAHEALRRRGIRPNVPLQVYLEGVAAVAAGERKQKTLMRVVYDAGASREARIAACRGIIEALPFQLNHYARAKSTKRFARKVKASMADVARAVLEALQAPESERGKPKAARGNKYEYVQQEDLEDLVPDGWGTLFRGDLRYLGRMHELPPKGLALLCLVEWCSRVGPAPRSRGGRVGVGLQASIDWLAKKLGCSDTWVKRVCNRLDPLAEHRRELAAVRRENKKRRKTHRKPLQEPRAPTGTTPYLHRYRRLQLYANAEQRGGTHHPVWVDKAGRVRSWVDVRGALYITEAGRALLVKRDRRFDTRSLQDLEHRLNAKLIWRLRARLGGDEVPDEDPVEKFFALSTAPPSRRAASSK